MNEITLRLPEGIPNNYEKLYSTVGETPTSDNKYTLSDYQAEFLNILCIDPNDLTFQGYIPENPEDSAGECYIFKSNDGITSVYLHGNRHDEQPITVSRGDKEYTFTTSTPWCSEIPIPDSIIMYDRNKKYEMRISQGKRLDNILSIATDIVSRCDIKAEPDIKGNLGCSIKEIGTPILDEGIPFYMGTAYNYLDSCQLTQENFEGRLEGLIEESFENPLAKEYFKSMMPFAIKAFQCAVVGPTIEVDGHYLGEYIYSFDIEKAKKFPSPRTRLASNYSIEGFVAAYCLALKYYDINSILTRSASQK